MKRWPIIRHIRCLYHAYWVFRWAKQCRQVGLGLGDPHPADLEHLDAIWEGRA